ncbi:MAG: hypothetical protein U0350_49145 [Caldilineaceae bacterium]
MKDYLDGAEADLLKRGQSLLSKIPSRLPREFHLLTQRCRDALTKDLNTLLSLKSLPMADRLRKFKRVVANIDFLEVNGVAALNRFTEDDRYLNILIERITQEINYPLLPPVVTSLSQGYFYIWPPLNLLCVPLGEADSLLHLPDLYHELAHPFDDERYEPRIQPYRRGLAHALRIVANAIALELEQESGNRSPQSYRFYFQTWLRSWQESWLIEFFCDLFATYTLGPAFAWSHLHLCAKRGGDPYAVPRYTVTTHPADDARMTMILQGLHLAGFVTEANIIAHRWQEFVILAGYPLQPEYRRCYNTQILGELAEIAYESVDKMGCRIATSQTTDPIHSLLSEAWINFWQNPQTYSVWEATAVSQLRHQFATK